MKQDKKFFFSVPKNLKYTGKGNWKAFYTKFTGYAEAAGWTDKQKREQLCWCLEDKASDFYTVLLESNKDIAFSTVVTKMVKRFGFQEPQETSQIQFQTITQKTEESLADWADRVLSLATQSFKDLSEEYMTKQAVMKFCQGCNDPEAGQHACGFKPVSVENAIDIIKSGISIQERLCKPTLLKEKHMKSNRRQLQHQQHKLVTHHQCTG
ncbi:unnamed protein product [Mytilus edulis]|uniref:Paraneoplastic antigen Ma-like C-terminal domain-containing protein n=1 Tax=Mytilus edulis TaxID=6550 RepID=A0A8S3RRT6_MYTED|nr:unnamed protein product [Mytilus edulis]